MTRHGFALLLAVLMSLLLSFAALGMVALATREGMIAGAAVRRVQARAHAESLARTLFDQWSTRALADMVPGDSRMMIDDAASTAVVDRVDSTLFLIRTEARVPPGSALAATGRAGLLVGVFDPGRIAGAFPAAVTVSGTATLRAGSIDGRDGCGSGRHAPGLIALSSQMDAGVVVDGAPPVVLAAGPEPPGPDPLAPPIIASLATLRPQPMTIAPRPLASGDACIGDSRNWGATASDHPCHPLRPLIFSDHDLTIVGGEAHAVLVVDGDLRLMGHARFTGLVVVRGTLTVDAGSSIQGAARGGTLILDGGVLRADPCAVDAAVAAPALDAAYRPSRRWWVPVF